MAGSQRIRGGARRPFPPKVKTQPGVPGGGARMTDRSYASTGPRPNPNQPLKGIKVAANTARTVVNPGRKIGLQAPQIKRATTTYGKVGKVIRGGRN